MKQNIKYGSKIVRWFCSAQGAWLAMNESKRLCCLSHEEGTVDRSSRTASNRGVEVKDRL